jgi:hypothetical protein
MRISIDAQTLYESPATRDATMLVLNEFLRGKLTRIQAWRDHYDRWPRQWVDASVESSAHLRVTAEELVEVGTEIDGVITRWVERTRDRQGDGVADVEVQWYTYPVGDPPDQ